MATKKPYISIIIPAYNAQIYVSLVIERVVNILKTLGRKFEVIVVSDGSLDDTFKNAEKAAHVLRDKVRVFSYKNNRGKGYAVRFGMQKAKGQIIGFIDCDEEIYPDSILSLLAVMNGKNADVVVGSKRHKDSRVVYPGTRKAISFIFYMLEKLLFNLPVSDTQAGIKLYKRTVLTKVLPGMTINGFAFDVEMLVLAHRMGAKVVDGPIKVDCRASSDASILKSFGIIRESIKMFADMLYLFLKTLFLKYNQS